MITLKKASIKLTKELRQKYGIYICVGINEKDNILVVYCLKNQHVHIPLTYNGFKLEKVEWKCWPIIS